MQTRRTKVAALIGLGLAVVVVVLFVVLSEGDSERRFGERESTEERSSAPPRPARRLGSTVRLKTYLTTIEVRPASFARLSGSVIGVDLVLRNVGRAAYRDQPSQAATVTLMRGGEAERVYEAVERCRGVPADTVRIPPGQVRRYCLPFATAGAAPDVFLYAPEAGLPGSRGAPEAAAWSF